MRDGCVACGADSEGRTLCRLHAGMVADSPITPEQISSGSQHATAWLIGRNGATYGLSFGIVGRGEEAMLKILHESVSREHAMLRREALDIVVSDLGSRNGTTVNGIPIVEQRLASGDVVKFGDVALIYSRDPRCRRPSTETGRQTIRSIDSRVASLAVELVVDDTRLDIVVPPAPSNEVVFGGYALELEVVEHQLLTRLLRERLSEPAGSQPGPGSGTEDLSGKAEQLRHKLIEFGCPDFIERTAGGRYRVRGRLL